MRTKGEFSSPFIYLANLYLFFSIWHSWLNHNNKALTCLRPYLQLPRKIIPKQHYPTYLITANKLTKSDYFE
ncbi:hypothetical protein CRG86_010665 [Photobacterium leiognathi]|nr:hypothetical protein CRG86_010665 [Photobacterium leiognathi]